MKVDIYHLYKHFEYSNFVYPIVLDVLKLWAEEIGFEARVRVCKEADIDYGSDAEMVAISVYTVTAFASYRVSEKMRALGKVVVLGGPHFRGSQCVEALPHCDVVASTICKEQWTDILRAVQAGDLPPGRPRATVVHDSENRFEYPRNFYETFRSQRWFQISSVPTSIGCPYDCSFCSAYLQGHYLLRDIETVYNELAHVPRKVVFLCDATFGLNKNYTMQLMERIAPLNKYILVETTLARLRDRDLLDALAKGGIKWVSVGIESLALHLSKHGGADLEENLRRVIADLHDRNILVQGNFICGLDSDGPESFERVAAFYKCSELDLIIIDLLTPYPNTAQYDSLVAESRIIDRNWDHYDYRHVVYQPKRMTAEQLIKGFTGLYREITSASVVWRKAQQLYHQPGIGSTSGLLMSYNVFARFDAERKAKLLERNLFEILDRRGPDVPAALPVLQAGSQSGTCANKQP